jgi:hypothetical protein
MLLGIIKNLNQKFIIVISICGCYTLSSCDQNTHLSPVTYGQFESFVNDTGYITDAERYGWSIVQSNVFDFTTVEGAIWQLPDGEHPVNSSSLPVTQVSYNDAIAYCKWANTRLPTYAEYWRLVKDDHRPIVSDNILPISDVDQVNIVGNVWDITEPRSSQDQVRLAGGSLFCSEATCDGTVSDRELSIDRETGNVHIGFSVVE